METNPCTLSFQGVNDKTQTQCSVEVPLKGRAQTTPLRKLTVAVAQFQGKSVRLIHG